MRHTFNLLQSILLLIVCLSLLTACAAKTEPVGPTQQDDADAQEQTVGEWNKIVAQFGKHTLTSVGFSYFYWASYTSFLNYHGSAAQDYLDLYTPLNEQMYSDELTWQDYFISDALMAFRQYCTINDLAEAEGFTLSETAQTTLDGAETELQQTAEAMGFTTIEEYLTANYGSGATLESYLDYVHDQFVVQEYTVAHQNSYTFTDEEVEAYYDEHADTYAESGVMKSDVKMAKLRYLMLIPEEKTDENYELLDSTFNEMLADWDTWEDKSEAGFMAFGEKWSEKGFAQDYLESVAPNTVFFSYFDDWVFDEPRTRGDTRTWMMESGDYLVYYVGQTDEIFWRSQARYDMCHEAFTNDLIARMANYSYTVHQENIIIAENEDLYSDVTTTIEPAE